MPNREYGIFNPETGMWLQDYDPNFWDDDTRAYPTGLATWTEFAVGAMRFESMIDAFEFWRQESTQVPRRPDGKPNRPLTSYTVSIEVLV